MRPFLLTAAMLALAACAEQAEAPADTDTGAAEPSVDAAASSAESPPPAAPAPADPEPAADAIPSAFHGRWGMVPADCTSTRGDAKGLIIVGPETIKFYESRAVLTEVTEGAPENFTGVFTFTGEGQTWTKSQNLKLTGSSNTLIRSETDPAGSYTYQRCGT